MSRYSIKELELLSNVKAHTIRIWEMRYNLLAPERTDTNIRFYDDEQLRKLLNVNTLLLKGMKISHISKLSDAQISAEVDLIVNDTISTDARLEALISSAVIAATTFDEALLEKIFDKAISKNGLVDTYINIIYPLLLRTGLMWASNEVEPAEEHFLSYFLERKMFAAIDSIPLPTDPDQTWVLFLSEPEEHELGLLIAYYILRMNNIKVVYLGRRLPTENLFSVIRQCNPTHIYTFFVKNHPVKDVQELLNRITNNFKKLKIRISGKKEIIENILPGKQIIWIKDVESLINLLKK